MQGLELNCEEGTVSTAWSSGFSGIFSRAAFLRDKVTEFGVVARTYGSSASRKRWEAHLIFKIVDRGLPSPTAVQFQRNTQRPALIING